MIVDSQSVISLPRRPIRVTAMTLAVAALLAVVTGAASNQADALGGWKPDTPGRHWELIVDEPISGEPRPRAASTGVCEGVDRVWRTPERDAMVEVQLRVCPEVADAGQFVGEAARDLPRVRELSIFGEQRDVVVPVASPAGDPGCRLVRWWAQETSVIAVSVLRAGPDGCVELNAAASHGLSEALPGVPGEYTDLRARTVDLFTRMLPQLIGGLLLFLVILIHLARPRYVLPRIAAFTDVTRRARRFTWGARLWTVLRGLRMLARFLALYQLVMLFVEEFGVLRLLAVPGCLLGGRICTFGLRWIQSEPFMNLGEVQSAWEVFLAGGHRARMIGGLAVHVLARVFAVALVLYYLCIALTYAVGPNSWALEAARARLAAQTTDSPLDLLVRSLLVAIEIDVFLLGLGLFLGLALAYFMDRVGSRIGALPAPALLDEHRGSHILYLRNFGDDRITIGAGSQLTLRSWLSEFNLFRRARFEEVAVRRLNAFGPVVALSDPHVRLSPLGAARQAESHGTWMDTVRELGISARVVVMSAAPKEVNRGLVQEIEWLATGFGHERIMLVLPPAGRRRMRRRWRDFLSAALDKDPEFYGGLPKVGGNGAAQVIVRIGGQWRAWGASTKTEASYVAGLLDAMDTAAPHWYPDGECGPLPLSGVVRTALDSAGPAAPVTTGSLLAALLETDTHGRWDRILLAAGYPTTAQLRAADEDVDSRPVALAYGITGTLALAATFARAEETAHRSRAEVLDVGVLVWALLRLPTTAQKIALAAGGSRDDLLRLVEEDLVGHDLPAARR